MDIISLLNNILVPVAIGMWVLIGIVALFVFLKNKLGGKIKPTGGNAYKQTFVQGCNANNSNSNNSNNNNSKDNNTNKTNLCL